MPLPATVGAFLEQDVQGSTRYADELIALIDQVASGSLQYWDGTGNAFELALTPDGASIDCLWADDKCKVSLADLRKSITGWRNFIAGPTAR